MGSQPIGLDLLRTYAVHTSPPPSGFFGVHCMMHACHTLQARRMRCSKPPATIGADLNGTLDFGELQSNLLMHAGPPQVLVARKRAPDPLPFGGYTHRTVHLPVSAGLTTLCPQNRVQILLARRDRLSYALQSVRDGHTQLVHILTGLLPPPPGFRHPMVCFGHRLVGRGQRAIARSRTRTFASRRSIIARIL